MLQEFHFKHSSCLFRLILGPGWVVARCDDRRLYAYTDLSVIPLRDNVVGMGDYPDS